MKSYKLIIVVLVFFKIIFINCQNNDYNQLNEKNCIDNILKLINNQFNNDINYCQDNGLVCQDNYVTEIIINQQSNFNDLVKASHFQCLSKLKVLKLSNFNLTIDFLNGPFNKELQVLHLNNNNLNGNLPELPSKTLKDIDISNNNLSGKIGLSWCYAKSNFSNNLNIKGDIPCCFSFFYNDPMVNSWFIGTSTKVVNSCLDINFPVMHLDSNTNKTEIVGGYLGYSDNSFYTEPNFKWTMETPYRFSCINCGLPQIFNITFPSAKKTYTISNYPSSPLLDSYSIQDRTFNGLHFGYNHDLISLEIEGLGKCIINESTFYSITISSCPNINFDENKSYNIKISIGSQSSSFQVNPTSGKVCSNDKCNNHGICDLNNQGDCKCEKGYLGSNCQAEIKCNNCVNGECDLLTGKCVCNNNWQSISNSNSCDTPLILCDKECEINGKCNNITGTCNCNNPIKWFGKSCQYPYHFITTIEPATNKTNNIAYFIGWFGEKYYNNISVEISPIGNCNILEINSTTLTCNISNETLPEGIYGNATVTQNNFTWIGIGQYYFERSIKQCPNNCSNQGKCNEEGICQCFTNWVGFDCGTYYPVYQQNQNDNQPLPEINTYISNNGTTMLNINQRHNNLYSEYQVFITNLLEIDIQGNTVANYSLFNNWNLDTIKYTDFINSGRILTFSQVLQSSKDNNSNNKNWLKSTVVMTIEEIAYGRIENFVNIFFPLESKSIKVSLSINNYQFSNSLNTLQLFMNSTMETVNNNFKYIFGEPRKTCYNSGNNVTKIQSDQFNYFLILKENVKLYGRFINKIIADGRATWISTSIQTNSYLNPFNLNSNYDDVTIKLNLPHCVSQCILDPDFSMLMDSILKISPDCINDDSNAEKKYYLIAIIVVVSFIILSIFVTIGILFYRKKYIENELQKKLKRLRENNYSNDNNNNIIFQ